jgi:iron(III) transport system permease protein
VVLALIGLESVDPELIDKARILGTDLRSLFRVVLPLAAPTILAGGGFIFLLSVMDYSVPSLFELPVYSLEIFAEYSSSSELARAFFLSLPLLLIALVVVILSQAYVRSAAQRPAWRIPAWQAPASWPAWFVGLQGVALFMLVAQVLVPLVSLSLSVKSWTNLARSITLARNELSFTFWITLGTALICLPLALAAARELVRPGKRGKLWWILVTAPLAIPPPLLGIGLIALWNRPLPVNIYGTSLMPILAGLARFTPIAALILLAQMRRLDPLLLDASRVMRVNPLRKLFQIKLPMIAPGLFAAAFITFALTLGELAAMLLVAPPGRATLTMRIYNFLHYGESSVVAGLCLLMAVAALAAGFLGILALVSGRRFFPSTEV